MTLSIHSPDELIAVIPHMLGFKPEESIVFVPVGSDLPVARVDLPATPSDVELVWRAIRDGLTRYARPGAALGIVCFTADRQQADLIGQEFASRLDTISIDTRVRLWADEIRWADLDRRHGPSRPRSPEANRGPDRPERTSTAGRHTRLARRVTRRRSRAGGQAAARGRRDQALDRGRGLVL